MSYIIIGGDGKEYGPIPDADLRQWITEGRLNAQSLAKSVSDAEFRPLNKFPEFADMWGAGHAAKTIAVLPLSNDDWLADVTSRQPELRLGECLSAGWSFLGANFGFLVGAVLLAWVTNLVFALAAIFIPILGPIIALCFHGVIIGGFYLACLRRQRGETVALTEVFSGFRVAFGQLVLTGLVAGLLMELSACCLILPMIYFFIAWFFAVPLVADRKMFFWSAMEVSRKVVTKVWFEAFAMIFVAFLPMLIVQVYGAFTTGMYFFGLYHQANENMQQFAQLMQSQVDQVHKLTWVLTAVGQAVYLLNLFYVAGVIIRAYENLFGPKKP